MRGAEMFFGGARGNREGPTRGCSASLTACLRLHGSELWRHFRCWFVPPRSSEISRLRAMSRLISPCKLILAVTAAVVACAFTVLRTAEPILLRPRAHRAAPVDRARRHARRQCRPPRREADLARRAPGVCVPWRRGQAWRLSGGSPARFRRDGLGRVARLHGQTPPRQTRVPRLRSFSGDGRGGVGQTLEISRGRTILRNMRPTFYSSRETTLRICPARLRAKLSARSRSRRGCA